MESTELADVATTTIGAVAPVVHDMSMWGLFWSADFIVKAIIIGLLLASFWSWSIIFNKVMKLRSLTKEANTFEDQFWSGGSLEDLVKRVGKQTLDPMRNIFSAAMREWQQAEKTKDKLAATLPQRVERVMQVTLNRELDELEKHLGFLATLGSTGVLVGLFGTVWGIINSFQSIAASHNTSLAVVAPGIAEALFATAIGLIAAIPAYVAYNKLSSEINRYGTRLDSFMTEFSSIVSRRVEEGK